MVKLYGSEKSMILDHVERPNDIWPLSSDGGLLKGAGEEELARHDPKGRFFAPKSFATGSK